LQKPANDEDVLFFQHLSASADLLKELKESDEICERGIAKDAISRLKVYTDVFEQKRSKFEGISNESNC
jgi:hypothetical protein